MKIDKTVAVYGTLRTGQRLEPVWAGRASSKVGVVKGFALVVRNDLSFPIARWSGDMRDVIVVEVLQFRTGKVFKEVLAELDRIEGHPMLYRRQCVSVDFVRGESVHAWMYVGAEPDLFLGGMILEDGDWSEWMTGLPTAME